MNPHSCYVMSRLRAIGLEKTEIQHILDTFFNPELDLEQCARTFHHLKAVEDEVTPKLVCS